MADTTQSGNPPSMLNCQNSIVATECADMPESTTTEFVPAWLDALSKFE